MVLLAFLAFNYVVTPHFSISDHRWSMPSMEAGSRFVKLLPLSQTGRSIVLQLRGISMTDRDRAFRAACYSHLDPNLAQFRTLTLCPGAWLEPVRCQLSVHSLDDAPKYKTISYAWGDPEDTKQIIVDGSTLAIPSSLELCLRHMRKSESASTNLWADAICIDQTNMAEKSIQVSNMGAVYWRCISMFIWLGMPSSSLQSRDPFEMVMHWVENKHFHQYPGFSISEESGQWVFHDNSAYQRMFESFADFTSKSWWHRLWCVQEIALCPAATMVFGHWRIPWASIVLALKTYRRHVSTCCFGAAAVMPAKYTYYADHLLFLSQQSDLTDMDTVVQAFRHKLCKNPRDKIYGLLGLLWKNRNVSLQPDYSLPVDRVYLQATEAIISQAEGSLHFLRGSGFNSHYYNLPSWVRNFAAASNTVEASYEGARAKRHNHYDACAGTRSGPIILDNTALSLTGISIDRIERVGVPIESRDWNDIWQVLQNWAEIAEVSDLGPAQAHGLLQERFWRTVMADGLPAGDKDVWTRISTPSNALIEDWFHDTIQHLRQGLEPLIVRPVRAMFEATYGRAFFRTESGHFGLCFPDACSGDEVWVLAGGKVPFILRRFDDHSKLLKESNTDPEPFRFIGECYLHGFMDGEALRDNDTLVPVHLR